ncbi:MAG: hypothetical protein SPI03_03200 [Campylobacter sputorum]|uniref:hypothetical protein n=1 Tax=Campylobacter sputorum TaxID=206 RepID=UPI000B781093|nr:hypothetical protein [Campylobacter sputorum]ASM39030.1 hypothetical protein CSPARA_1487 [Campylobacter sputorum bv. paraureolyticus LMG 11764]MDY6120334.1 hypothetical protein [Campylobacter sputorum]
MVKKFIFFVSILFLSIYAYASDITIRFMLDTKATPLFVRQINDSLESLGYNFVLIKNFQNSQNGSVLEVFLETNNPFDGTALLNELKKRNIIVLDSKTSNEYYLYSLSLSKSILQTNQYEKNKLIELQRPLEDYVVDIRNSQSIEIMAKPGDNWFVNVKILDEDMNLISAQTRDKPLRSFTLPIPQNAYYIVISDAKNLENIKRGLNIYIHSR